jgi:uncharacterized protein (UPF0276 family)
VSVDELGVGIVYTPGLEPLLESRPDLVTALELEPQTLWRYLPGEHAPFVLDRDELERIAAMPQRKLVHGVGFPVGGSQPADERHIAPLVETIDCLRSAWASEHLGFNSFSAADGRRNTGFLLPPLQTRAGVEAAAVSVAGLAARLPVAFSIETGVNYLRTGRGQLSDGAFVAAVAEQADCGILLDLHNVWANERNGRQTVKEFVAELPLERVNELHIAGGLEYRGYWLDAHSGGVPEQLLELAAWVVPRLPNLGAIVFELLPQFMEPLGVDGVERELEKLARVWERRAQGAPAARHAPAASPRPQSGDELAVSAPEWEAALGALVIGRAPQTPLGAELAEDPGIEILRELVGNFRSGMIVDALRLTSRLLMLSGGRQLMPELLSGFYASAAPELFASAEAEAFAAYLRARAPAFAHLDEVLAYECASLRALLDGESQFVRFAHEPMAVLRPLLEGRLPEDPPQGDYEVEVPPDRTAAPAALGHVLTST